ncbi:MAG: acyl CoA--acetate/3-ketoacid CoA transferase subunit alpha, partial [Actinomycetota bacterium]
HTLRINRSMVDGVIEAPLGAHFTSCEPDYPVPGRWLQEYAGAAKDAESWTAYRSRLVDVSDDDYRRAVA